MSVEALIVTLALFVALGSIGLAVSLLLDRQAFFETVWKRHYNPWSWSARFFFAFVLYVGIWLHSWPVIVLSIAALATCSFWFPVPQNRDTFIAHAVNGEVLWKRQPWTVRKAVFPTVLGLLTVVGLYALWEHHVAVAVACLGAVTLYKLWWLKGLAELSRAQGKPL